MNIGLFGGTFDPIHLGHTALARAANEKFKLGRIYFVPAYVPPHKERQPVTPYCHRYAMVALATAGEKTFVPSLLEAPEGLGEEEKSSHRGSDAQPRPNYSIDTVRRLKLVLKKSDQLFFLIGMDAFENIAKWHKAGELFQECEFIVASRPGHSLADVANALPESLRPAANVTKPFAKQPARGDLVLRGATVRLLEGVHHPASATAIRQAASANRPLKRFVDPRVEEYIRKMELYR
jgi:nicotinate-nucleotide adenylyltransferase